MLQVGGVSRRGVVSAAPVIVLLTAAACGSSSTSVTGPSSAKCEVSVTNNTPEVPASGGSGTVTVTTTRDCMWSASAEAPWISLSSTRGQGPATVNYAVQPNPAGTARHGRVVIAQQSVDVAQAAAPCRYAVSPASVSVDASGGQSSIALTATDGCKWTARSDVPWIANVAPADGVGSATIRFAVALNTAQPRSGTVAIGNATVAVNQSGAPAPPAPAPQPPAPAPSPLPAPNPNPAPTPAPTPSPTPSPAPCTYSIKPTYYNAGKGPDDILINVTTGSGCTWTTTTDASWVTIAAGASSAGSGSVRLLIPANSGAARSANVTIAGNAFSLQQQGACTATLKPTWYNAGRGPDDFRIAVTVDPGCSWTATSTASWATIADGASGSGNGSVRVLVDANSGPARSVTLSIAGQPFALIQNGSQ